MFQGGLGNPRASGWGWPVQKFEISLIPETGVSSKAPALGNTTSETLRKHAPDGAKDAGSKRKLDAALTRDTVHRFTEDSESRLLLKKLFTSSITSASSVNTEGEKIDLIMESIKLLPRAMLDASRNGPKIQKEADPVKNVRKSTNGGTSSLENMQTLNKNVQRKETEKVPRPTRRSYRELQKRNAENPEGLTKAIAYAVGNSTCRKLTDNSLLEIRDVDKEASDQKILQAISDKADPLVNAPTLRKKNNGRGTQTVLISVPTSLAATLITIKLRIGYVNCRVHCSTQVMKCFKYQDFGHRRFNCKCPDRQNHCSNCGAKEHHSKVYNNNPKCLLCSKECSDDHSLGSFRFHVIKRTLEATKKAK
ncbi:Hypothetical protein CINCED_3A019671 [Cinara cedri]|uniref:Uncharacterized protein n=1 Tax=Cinara cedri TaxID=506608 RepID=A0A5E4MGV3_9HEMI|nr:Hypothetical protein CINCED_3A019671 [Cinara cedri]